jgi:hypothetical protein
MAVLVTFKWGNGGILLVNRNIQLYGLQFVSSDIYKEDDCFKNDDNGKILYLLVSDSVVSMVYYQLLICFLSNNVFVLINGI